MPDALPALSDRQREYIGQGNPQGMETDTPQLMGPCISHKCSPRPA